MIAAKGYHALLALAPPDDLDFEKFSPISLYVCGKCGQIRMYSARQEAVARDGSEVVSYRYRISREEPGEKPAVASGADEHESRRSRA